MPHVVFRTLVNPTVLTFTVKPAVRHVCFRTGVTAKTAIFFTGDASPGILTTSLSDNQHFLLITLSKRMVGSNSYTLHAIREGDTREETVSPLAAAGVQGWSFPLASDGVWYLTVKDGPTVVSQTVALVNYKSLRQLARYRKQIVPKLHLDFDKLCYYNGLVILLYETSQFAACQALLTFLYDLSTPCT